jgi:hypothetical protein
MKVVSRATPSVAAFALNRWIVVYPGVYRLPGAPFSTDQGHMAAVLAGARTRSCHMSRPACGGVWMAADPGRHT